MWPVQLFDLTCWTNMKELMMEMSHVSYVLIDCLALCLIFSEKKVFAAFKETDFVKKNIYILFKLVWRDGLLHWSWCVSPMLLFPITPVLCLADGTCLCSASSSWCLAAMPGSFAWPTEGWEMQPVGSWGAGCAPSKKTLLDAYFQILSVRRQRDEY